MYTIIFIAAFLISRYLWQSRKIIAARILLITSMLVGCAVFSMSIGNKAWQPVNGAFFGALIIVLLAELYMKLAHFEIKK